MSALPYMPLYVADYLADAAHLTTEEHGAYLLLIMNYWQRGKPLPADSEKLARIARMTNERWTDVERTLNDFFEVDGDLWRHKRIDAELSKVKDKSEKAKQAGLASARGKKATDVQRTSNERSTDVEQTFNHTDTDTEQIQSKAEAKDDRAAACVEIGKRVTDVMGVTNDPRWLGNWSTVSVWLAQGFDPELDIIPTVTATVERVKRTGKAMPGSLKYFSRAIEENYKARIATGESPAQKSTKEFFSVKKGTPQHRAWMEHYRQKGKRMAFYEAQEVLTVPTEYPPAMEQAA